MIISTPYYAHLGYNDKTDSEDGIPDEDVNAIDEIPAYSPQRRISFYPENTKQRYRTTKDYEEKQAPRTARRIRACRLKPIRRGKTQQA